VAQALVRRHEELLGRVLAWQQAVYGDHALPGWLRDCLVNSLHLITETGVWGQAKPPIGSWCREEDGLFAMSESPRMDAQLEPICNSAMGNFPLVYFFPRLALSTLRGYKAYQYEDGQPPWVFGGFTVKTGWYELVQPDRGYQQSLNGCCYVAMVDRLWQRTGDDALLREFYESAKRCTAWQMTLRPEYGDLSVISMPTGNVGTEWFEAPEPGWKGMCTHIGGIRLATLLMARRMAHCMGDQAFAEQCQGWLDAGAKAMEEHLWAGDYYRNFVEPETGTSSELVFANQLDGQWFARIHGTPDAFPRERIDAVLAKVERCNVALTRFGAVNYANPDGSVASVGGYGPYGVATPTMNMLAMTYIYEGQPELGLELGRRLWHDLVCRQGLAWDMPCLLRGDQDTGERYAGQDYYFNMICWAFPAALEGGDSRAACRPGGLVDRVMKAGAGAERSARAPATRRSPSQ
jgi:uncharacterized protein (DUF608 family)